MGVAEDSAADAGALALLYTLGVYRKRFSNLREKRHRSIFAYFARSLRAAADDVKALLHEVDSSGAQKLDIETIDSTVSLTQALPRIF